MALPNATSAQSGPAEPPPPDFAGRQYIDSQGCAFVRADIGGTVTWAPRLTADRQPLCGFQPTRAAGLGQSTGSLPSIRPDAPPVILDGATVVGTAATAAPAAAPASARPGVPRRSDVHGGKAPVSGAVPSGQRIPRGWRPVWDDDRLNRHRGPRTAAGDAAMRRIWTDDVPMQLVPATR